MSGTTKTRKEDHFEMPNLNHLRHERMMYGDVKLYAGTACPELALAIARHLDLELCGRDVITFPNDDLFVKLHGSSAGKIVM
jgi:ribose-phosphate pyrophosphokinase